MAGAAYRSNEQGTSTGKCGQIYDGISAPNNHMKYNVYFGLSLLRNWLLPTKAAQS